MKRCARRSRSRVLRQLIRFALGPLTGRVGFSYLEITPFPFAPNGA